MRLEYIPVLFGLIVGAFGVAVMADALAPDSRARVAERRRRGRPDRNLPGEAMLGGGIVCLAATLVGGEGWPYATPFAIIALALVLAGVVLNAKYIRGRLFGPVLGRERRRRSTDSTVQSRPTDSAAPSADAPTSDAHGATERK